MKISDMADQVCEPVPMSIPEGDLVELDCLEWLIEFKHPPFSMYRHIIISQDLIVEAVYLCHIKIIGPIKPKRNGKCFE